MRLANFVYGPITTFLLLPIFVSAEDPNPQSINSFIANLGGWVSSLIPIFIGIGFLVFLYGLIKYVTAGADEAEKTKARGLMIYGIIALFVMVSAWGLVGFLGEVFGIDDGALDSSQLPTIGGLTPLQ